MTQSDDPAANSTRDTGPDGQRAPGDSAAPEESGPYSALYTRYVLGMVLVTMVLNNIDRTILSILVRPVKEEFQLTDTQMGWLLGPAFALVYTLISLTDRPLCGYDGGSAHDRLGQPLLLWSLFTAGTAFVSSYAQLFVMRMGVGVGEAGGTAPSVSMLADYLPPARRARGVSVISIGAVTGMGLGHGPGRLAERSLVGWRGAFIAAGVPRNRSWHVLYHLTIQGACSEGGSEGRQGCSGTADFSGVAHACC